MTQSKRHKNLKQNALLREKSGKQMTIEETQVRLKEKQLQSQTVIHDYIRASAYSAIPLNKSDGYLGKFVRKWIP